MSTVLARIKTGYTSGGRSVGRRFAARLHDVPLTANQVTLAGFAVNVAAAVLAFERAYVLAAVVFVAGSLLDVLDGALARLHAGQTPFGGFLDSTTDRLSEAFVLGAIGLVLAEQGHEVALACVFVALVGSFLVSYTRAKAEALGLRGDVGLMARAERVVVIAAMLALGGVGGLRFGMYLLAALTAFTVLQRVVHVYRELIKAEERP
jgi:CDP-diacylglycerol--glycerol-3-phosphate 3-phosphatidyltransferase